MLFSSYGSQQRQGPTVGMALVSIAHYQHPDVEMVRVGAMAPMFPFSGSGGGQLGITTDHRAFYDIMRRLNAIFDLSIDLAELKAQGDAESQELLSTLERISSSNPDAKKIIDQVRADYTYTPFVQPVELDPALDQTLEDILRNVGDEPSG